MPTSEQIRLAWTVLAQPDTVDGTPAEERARHLGHLLAGLVSIAAGHVRDEAGQELSLVRVVRQATAHSSAGDWQADVVHDGAVTGRPFLPELARRALALGYLDGPYADEDLLLNPRSTRIDPACADAALAFARAVTAIELQNADLLAAVVVRHLETRAGHTGPPMTWAGPLLEDTTAQSLLVGALAAGDRAEGKRLFRLLVADYERSRQQAEEAPNWPAGPLTGCCALGLLLRHPREAALLTEFKQRIADWSGWQDANAWPTRYPANNLDELKARLTDRAAQALGVGERKLWPRGALTQALEGCWPALLSFSFTLAAAGCSPGAAESGRGERDESPP